MEGFGYRSGPKHQGFGLQAAVAPPVPHCSRFSHFSSLPFIFTVGEVHRGCGSAHTSDGEQNSSLWIRWVQNSGKMGLEEHSCLSSLPAVIKSTRSCCCYLPPRH